MLGEIRSEEGRDRSLQLNGCAYSVLGCTENGLPACVIPLLFVFPSLRESSAKVIYEALAAGLPVITTYNTGSVVENGKQGFIVPTKNPKAIMKKIIFLYNNPKKREKMSQSARKLAEKYTWDYYGKRVCDIYEKIIKAK